MSTFSSGCKVGGEFSAVQVSELELVSRARRRSAVYEEAGICLLLLFPCNLMVLGAASTPGPWEENSVQSPQEGHFGWTLLLLCRTLPLCLNCFGESSRMLSHAKGTHSSDSGFSLLDSADGILPEEVFATKVYSTEAWGAGDSVSIQG